MKHPHAALAGLRVNVASQGGFNAICQHAAHPVQFNRSTRNTPTHQQEMTT